MKTFMLCLLLSTASVAAEAGVPDGGTPITISEVHIVGSVDAGVQVDAGVPAVAVTPSIDHPWSSMKGFYQAVRSGNWWVAAMFLLFFVVGLIRVVGKRIHDMLAATPRNKVLLLLQKFLKFVFDTKIGGWLLNWMSAVGGCLSTAALAGMEVDAAAWKVAIMASTGGTALIELKDDVLEWWDARTERIKTELAAKLAAAEAVAKGTPTPPSTPAEPPKAS